MDTAYTTVDEAEITEPQINPVIHTVDSSEGNETDYTGEQFTTRRNPTEQLTSLLSSLYIYRIMIKLLMLFLMKWVIKEFMMKFFS